MKEKGISATKIAATYIGTIVGAGFATGQEVMQFFLRFGFMGLIGLVFAAVLFIIFGYIIMELGKKLNSNSHLEIIKYSAGNYFGTVIDFIITFFLFGAFTSMIAGTGALFAQQFNWSSLWGNILMAIVTAITVMTGIKGVINAISFIVPFLLIAVIGTSIFAIINSPPDIFATAGYVGESSLISNWLIAPILYVSYNTLVTIAVLGSLGVNAQDRSAIRNGAIIGGLGLGLGSIMIYLALAANIQSIGGLELPMMFIAGGISYPVQVFYALVLIAEVYSTSVGSLYGFVSRITNINRNPARGRILVIGSTLAGILASQLGFSNLVRILYPLVGYGGMVLLFSLIIVKIKQYGWFNINNLSERKITPAPARKPKI